MEYNCSDRSCFVQHEFMDLCIVYDQNSPNCSIPCRLESCSFHVHNEIVCPIYHCTPFTTTTTTVKPDPTTITPVPEVHYDGWTISSFCFTTIMVLIIILICIKYVRRFLQKRRQSEEREELLNLRQSVYNPCTGFRFQGILFINIKLNFLFSLNNTNDTYSFRSFRSCSCAWSWTALWIFGRRWSLKLLLSIDYILPFDFTFTLLTFNWIVFWF
jgi:hypothetical protein